MTELAQATIQRNSDLLAIRAPWESLWREAAQYCMPRRAPGIQGSVEVPGEDESRLFDTTAVQANMTLAAGQMSWMTPLEAAWFAIEPQNAAEPDEFKRWLSRGTAVLRNTMATSSFYEAIHEFYLDRGCFGTAAMYIGSSEKRVLKCEVWPVGTFVIDADSDGRVDTVIRSFELDARQSVEKFGMDNVHPKVAERVAKNKDTRSKIRYLHAVLPRSEAERDGTKKDPENMPIASIYIDADHVHVAELSGYNEFPVMVSRYLRWGSGMGSLYGWCPAFAALADVRQLNVLQKMLDAQAEKAAFPAILAPDTLEGEIDANAHGITYYSADMGGAKPEEWLTQGRFDIGLQRVQERQESIEKAFHVDLFKMFAGLEKQMTATEIMERSQEKLIQFSPTFAGLVSEVYNPLLERAFNLILRRGLVEPPPGFDPNNPVMPPMKVEYSSRIALALRAIPAIGYVRTLQRVGSVAGLKPDILDNFDFDAAERQTAMDDGLPAEYLIPQTEVVKIRKLREQAAQEQAAAEKAAMMAEGAGKLAGIKEGSPIDKLMSSGEL